MLSKSLLYEPKNTMVIGPDILFYKFSGDLLLLIIINIFFASSQLSFLEFAEKDYLFSVTNIWSESAFNF